MTEVVWVALITAGTALVTALVTQLLATRASSKQADRGDQREALQWQRSEALRLEELRRAEAQEALAWQRADAKESRERHVAALRLFWTSALSAQNRIVDGLSRAGRLPLAGESASSAAAHCYSVALIELPVLREPAKAFYLATAEAETAMAGAQLQRLDVVNAWRSSFNTLEVAVIAAADTAD